MAFPAPAFSAALKKCQLDLIEDSCFCLLGNLPTLSAGLFHTRLGRQREHRAGNVSTHLDDTDSDSLPHVSDSESSKGRIVGVGLDTEGFLGNELDDGGVSGLDELGRCFHDLPGTRLRVS